MADYTVKLTPDLVNLGTEGSLDTALVESESTPGTFLSLQRTMNAIMIINGTDRKMVGNLADGDTFDDVVLAVGDAGYFGQYENLT